MLDFVLWDWNTRELSIFMGILSMMSDQLVQGGAQIQLNYSRKPEQLPKEKGTHANSKQWPFPANIQKKNSGSSLKYCYFKATNTTYHWTPVLQHLYDSLILMTILQVAVWTEALSMHWSTSLWNDMVPSLMYHTPLCSQSKFLTLIKLRIGIANLLFELVYYPTFIFLDVMHHLLKLPVRY